MRSIREYYRLYPSRFQVLLALIAINIFEMALDYTTTTQAGTVDWQLHIPTFLLTFFIVWSIVRKRAPAKVKAMAECGSCRRLFIAQLDPHETFTARSLECPECFFAHSAQVAVTALLQYLNHEYQKKGVERIAEILHEFDAPSQ